MNGLVKKYLPYGVVILLIYMLVPIIFISKSLQGFSTVAYYFIFPATAIVCAAMYCSKYGMDFLFTLIAPVVFIPSMLIYNGGFHLTNIILLVAYLISGIFGLFVGDIAFGDKRKKAEAEAEAEAEERLLAAKRRNEEFVNEKAAEAEAPKAVETTYDLNDDDDDFDYSKYASTDKVTDESEIDEEHNTIALTQQKTGSRAIIPLMPLAKEIISKYKNKEIKYYRDDNSAVNGYLKEVAKQAGLNESITFEEKGVKQTKPLHSLIHTHTARHTFITIMCRKNISKEVLIIATGHEDTKLIDKVYLHLSAKDKAKKVAEAFNEANKTEEQSSTVLVPPINNLESLKMFIQNLEEELKGFNNIKQKRESSEESKSSKFFDILFYKRLTELALNIKTAKSRGIKLDKSTDTIYSQLIDSINKGVETKDIMYHEASLKYESVAKDRDKLISLVRGWLELGISMDTISKYIYRASNYGIDTDGFDIIISRTLEYIVTD